MPLASELSSGVLDVNSSVFMNVLTILCVLLGVSALVGIAWDMFYFKRSMFVAATPGTDF
jgi:hypothetical protein